MNDTTSFNQLTPAAEERLHLLQEECAEVIHITSKILRHGLWSKSPKTPGGPTNQEMLAMEIGQVLATIQILYAANDVAENHVEAWREDKLRSVGRYLHHNNITQLFDGRY